MFFPCFISTNDAVLHARIIAKWIVPFLLLPNLGRVSMPLNPISLPSTPQNSTSAPLFRCLEPPFPHTPKHHLGCPILPFGVSHFTIWGILRRVYAPILAPFYPLFALISSHFRGKNGRQNVCLSPQLSGNQTTRSLLQCPHAG